MNDTAYDMSGLRCIASFRKPPFFGKSMITKSIVGGKHVPFIKLIRFCSNFLGFHESQFLPDYYRVELN